MLTFWLFWYFGARLPAEQQTAQLTPAFATRHVHGVSGRDSPCTLNSLWHQKEANPERIIIFISVSEPRNATGVRTPLSHVCLLTFSRHPASFYPKTRTTRLETNQSKRLLWNILFWKIVCDFRPFATKNRWSTTQKRYLWRWPFGVVFRTNVRDGNAQSDEFSIPTNVLVIVANTTQDANHQCRSDGFCVSVSQQSTPNSGFHTEFG